MLNIFVLIFPKKAVFSKETAKISSEGAFDHFVAKVGLSGKKLI